MLAKPAVMGFVSIFCLVFIRAIFFHSCFMVFEFFMMARIVALVMNS